MTEVPNQDLKPGPAPRRGDGEWRSWIVPGIFCLLFAGFAALRPPGACGPGACAMPPAVFPSSLASGGAAPADPSLTPAPRLAVLYLHGTVRCETCLEIEQIAERTVRESFPQELATGTVSWQSVDYDLPENAGYDRAFTPSCPSLVLAEPTADGGFARHQILADTWERIHDGPQAVEAYVRREIQEFRLADPTTLSPPPEALPTP